MSLTSGIIFGLILAFGATLTSKNPKNIWVTLSKYKLFFISKYILMEQCVNHLKH